MLDRRVLQQKYIVFWWLEPAKLISWVGLFWFLVTPIARYLLHLPVSVYLLSAIAAFVCLIPAIFGMVLAILFFADQPDSKLLAVFALSIVRMIFVVGVAYYLSMRWDFFQSSDFLVWLSAYYLLILTLETYLMIKQRLRSVV